jgi:charged multivesicular body protein 1
MSANTEFNLRFTKKMIEKEAKAAEKKYEASRKKALDAMKKSGDVEIARIYAETAIQNRTSHNQFLIMASRIDSIISKVSTFDLVFCIANQRTASSIRRFNKRMHKMS